MLLEQYVSDGSPKEVNIAPAQRLLLQTMVDKLTTTIDNINNRIDETATGHALEVEAAERARLNDENLVYDHAGRVVSDYNDTLESLPLPSVSVAASHSQSNSKSAYSNSNSAYNRVYEQNTRHLASEQKDGALWLDDRYQNGYWAEVPEEEEDTSELDTAALLLLVPVHFDLEIGVVVEAVMEALLRVGHEVEQLLEKDSFARFKRHERWVMFVAERDRKSVV